MKSPLERLEEKRKELVAKGFTGISIFPSRNEDVTLNGLAEDVLKMLDNLDKAVPIERDKRIE